MLYNEGMRFLDKVWLLRRGRKMVTTIGLVDIEVLHLGHDSYLVSAFGGTAQMVVRESDLVDRLLFIQPDRRKWRTVRR